MIEKTVCVVEVHDPKREEEDIIRDAEKVQAGEKAESGQRADELADGVDFAISPEDVEIDADNDAENQKAMDFDDPQDDEDHGRGLV